MKKLLSLLMLMCFTMGAWAETTISKTVNELAEANSWTVSSGNTISTLATEFSLDDVITISTTGNPNCGSIWGSDTKDWRLYQNQNGNVIVTAATGYALKSVKFTFTVSNSGTLVYGEEGLTSNTDFSLNKVGSATFTVGNSSTKTNGQVKITSFSVTYEENTGGSGTGGETGGGESGGNQTGGETVDDALTSVVSFVANVDKGSSTATSADEMTKAIVKISSTNAALATAEYRLYASSTTSISSTENITKIVFHGEDSKNPLSNLSVKNNNGTYSTTEHIWTGKSKKVEFQASAQARTTQIDVYVEGALVEITSAGYATLYYEDYNLVVPEGVEVNTYAVLDDELLESWEYKKEAVIPKGTGVVLKGEQGFYVFAETTATGVADEDNMLRGSDVDASTAVEGDEVGTKYYKLSLNSAGDLNSVGFYWGAADGAAFTNPAHKAYLVVPAESTAKAFLFNGATAIEGIDAERGMQNAQLYNLAGQKVSNEYKGIVIKNGKKYVNK